MSSFFQIDMDMQWRQTDGEERERTNRFDTGRCSCDFPVQNCLSVFLCTMDAHPTRFSWVHEGMQRNNLVSSNSGFSAADTYQRRVPMVTPRQGVGGGKHYHTATQIIHISCFWSTNPIHYCVKRASLSHMRIGHISQIKLPSGSDFMTNMLTTCRLENLAHPSDWGPPDFKTWFNICKDFNRLKLSSLFLPTIPFPIASNHGCR